MEIPERPRLADHVRMRLHRVGGAVRVALHDPDAAEVLVAGEAERAVLSALDGTRDPEGVRLAARAAGVTVTAAELAAFLGALGSRGMLAAGPPRRLRPEAIPVPDRPLSPLPGYTFRCDGDACCRSFGTVLFTPPEARRARGLTADRPDDGVDRLFTPDSGSVSRGLSAVALRDGACAFLSGGRCALHAAAGPEAKPAGCRQFPFRYVDDGERVRVSVRVECPCVVDSARDDRGAPLASGGRSAAELVPAPAVDRLAGEVALGPARRVDRSAGVALVDALTGVDPGPDPVPSLLAAAAVLHRGAGADEAVAAFATPARLAAADALAGALAIRARQIRLLAREMQLVRGPRDPMREATSALADAALALTDDETLAALLSATPADPLAESLTVRSALFGMEVLLREPLSSALVDVAARLVLARALPAVLPAGDNPLAREPLTLVGSVAGTLG